MTALRKFFSTRPLAYYAGLTIISLAITTLFLFVVWPYALGQAVRLALAEPGTRDVRVERVTFNPLNAQLRMRELRIDTPEQQVLRVGLLYVNLDFPALLEWRVHVEEATLRDIAVRAVEQNRDGVTEIAGFALSQNENDSADEEKSGKWRFGIDRLEIQNTEIAYAQPDRDTPLRIVHLELQNLTQWESEQSAELRLSIEVSEGEFAAQGNFHAFSQTPNATFNLELAGVRLSPLLQFVLPRETARIEGALAADLKLVFETPQGSPALFTAEGMVELTGLDGEIAMKPRPQFKVATIGWQGDARATLDPDVPQFSLKGEMRAAGLNATQGSANIRQDTLNWRGTIDSAPPRAALPVSAAGDFTARGISLSDAAVGRAQVAEITVAGLQIAPDRALSLGSLSVTGIALNPAAQAQQEQEDETLLSVGSLMLEPFAMPAPDRLEIGQMRISDLAATLVRNADGLLNSAAVLGKADAMPSNDQPGAAENTTTQPFSVRIGGVTVDGKSHLRFHDHAVSPAVNVAAENISLKIGVIDRAHPDAQTPFTLAMDFRDFGAVTARGNIVPFAATPEGDVALQISTLELPVISAYTQRYLGYALTRGRLDAKVDATVAAGQLNADSELKLSKLKMDVADQDKAAPLQAQIDLPINAALSLLRDSDDIIALSLPISGPLDNPQIGLGQVINKALGKALKATVATTLTALFPVTGVLVVANLAGTPKLKFNPVTFDPGQDGLADAQTGYLDQVAALLEARPAVELTFCGRVTGADREALAGQVTENAGKARPADTAQQAEPAKAAEPSVTDAALLSLGDRRVNRVKRYLVDQHAIAPARMFECKSAIEAGPDARPHVEVLM